MRLVWGGAGVALAASILLAFGGGQFISNLEGAPREILEGVLEAVSDEGGAVVYASHLVSDLERVCDRIAFLDDGRLRFESSLEALKAGTKRARAVFEGQAPSDPDLPGRIDWSSEGRVLTVVAQVDNGELAAK